MKKLKGIRSKRNKWEVYVRVAGTLRTTTFDTLDVPKMRAWQETQRRNAPLAPAAGSFAADVEAYLEKPRVAAMRYVGQKSAHLLLWLEALGRDRPRASITSDEIEAVLQTWLAAGLSAATVYHRRSTLSSLITTLDGVVAANPVRGTTRPDPWTPRDHSVDYATLGQILAAMPDERRPTTGIRQPATAKLVVAVLMATGVRGVDLARVRRQDVNLDAAMVQMPRSGKGKGVKSWILRLTPEALEAFRAFDAANLYGAFDPAAVSHSFKRACRRVLGRDTPVHLYSLRHSVGAELYRETGDLATVGRVLGHTPGSPMTEQYARGAHEDVDRAALAAFSARRAAVLAASQKLAAKLGAPTSPSKRNRLQRLA